MRKLLIGILICWTFCLQANDFLFKTYNVLEGLPQSQVYDVLQGKGGYLWLATRGGGLARFDGNSFENFTQENGLVNNFLLSLFQDSKGRLWIGSSHGVSYYNGIKFSNKKLSGNNAVAVSSIGEFKGQIVLGTTNGLYVFDGKKYKNVTEEWNIPSYVVGAVNVKGDSLIVGHNKGVSIVYEKTTKNYGRAAGLTKPFVQAISVNKRIFFGVYGGGVYQLKGDGLEIIPGTDGLIVTDLMEEAGFLWITTQKNGLLKWDITQERIINLSEGLSSLNCRSIIKDSWGNYWIGSSGGGLNKYYTNEIQSFLPKDGLPGNYIYALANSKDSSVWLSTNALGLINYRNKTFTSYGVEEGIYSLKYRALLEDNDGDLWMGTEGTGLILYDGKKSKILNAPKYLYSNYVKDILQDKLGNVWVATSGGGISKIQKMGEKFKVDIFSSRGPKKIHSNYPTCLHEDKKGRIWFGTRGQGLGCIENGEQIFIWNKNKKISGKVVRSIAEGSTGNLYVGIAGSGVDVLNIYDAKIYRKTLNKKYGLSSTNIFSLMADGNKLWIGTDRGCDQLLLEDKNVKQFINFGREDGFIGVETTQNATLKDLFGNHWWGTINGLMLKKSGEINKKKDKPIVSIEGMRLFYNPIQDSEYGPKIGDWFRGKKAVLFGAKDNNIGFQFKGVDLNHPNEILFQWKLEGMEESWSPLSTQNQIMYSNLAPGKYTFWVRAVNKLGNVSKPFKGITFVVATPFYFKWWFLLTLGLLGIASGLGIMKWRINLAKRKLNEEREKLEMEKELLSLEQKALRLQMNPHFIFNALNSVQDLIRENNNKEARYSLAKFSKLMRNILDFSNESRVTLDREIALLNDYLTIEKISKDSSFEFEIKMDEEIEDEVETIPPMLLQPFIENSIVHGLVGVDGARIVVRFSIEGDYLSCSVEDNGIGREAVKAQKAQEEQKHKSRALEVTQARLTKINGEHFKSFEILDLKTTSGGASGTRVNIKVKRELLF